MLQNTRKNFGKMLVIPQHLGTTLMQYHQSYAIHYKQELASIEASGGQTFP